MIFGFSWPFLLTCLLGLAFIVNGVANAIGPREMRENFTRWGFPRGWHLVNAAVCLTTGVLLLVPPAVPIGFVLAALECLAIYLTLVINREFKHLPPSMILLAILGMAFFGTYGLTLPAL
jgi:hypothetical protein